ncbi:MAG: 40S ribosomal protein S3a/S1 [Candidatus Nanohaloarchaea archaeon]|nr:40S ribosomal protein S3a/S1 [Candidatus Nanohaloarchaea archaeon]
MAQSLAQKKWFDVVAPKLFDKEKISETPAESAEQVEGRTVRIGLKELMPSSNKYYMNVTLQVERVDGKKAKTRFVGHQASKEYVSKLVSRRTDRIDHVVDVETEDGEEVRVKLIGVAMNKASSSAKTGIRKKMEEIVEEKASEQSLNSFAKSIFKNQIQKEIAKRCNKVTPLKSVEIRKTEVKEQ